MPGESVPLLEPVNEVHLIGRVSAEPVPVVLPSGESVVTVRVIVDRPRLPAGRGQRRRVDTIACAAWSSPLRRTVMRWSGGDIVEVEGAIRRRFWRAEGVPQSRYEVELTAGRRLARAPRPAAPSASA
jgi:single-strand DNA-binding protein